MPKKDTTQTINVDPATQRFQDEQLRPGAIQAADALRNLPQFGPDSFRAFMDPFQREVIDGVRGDFDRQRTDASTRSDQIATLSGAFGGSRGEVLKARFLNDINRDETGTLSRIRSQGFSQSNQLAALMQQLQTSGLLAPLQALVAGLGVPGQTQTQEGDFFGGLAKNLTGAATAASGF